jgi:hypothetical protein
MSKPRWPRGCAVFRLARDTNEHWRKGDTVELLEVDPDPKFIDYRVRHYCDHAHQGVMWIGGLDSLDPLNADARAMLRIAKQRSTK